MSPLPNNRLRAVSWEHNPDDPVPSRVHPYFTLVDMPDERDVVQRSDVAVWRAAALNGDEHLLGRVSLAGTVHSSGVSCQVVATVYDEFPSGRLRRLAGGATTAHAPWPATVDLDLGTVGWRLKRGHRLCLVLSGSSFPKFVLHPGTDEEPWFATEMQSIVTSLDLGGPHGARLTISVLPTSKPKT
jgi:predicted acyl esterase